MVKITKRTPAKINLCLLVGPKDDSDNHEIFTVFVPVDVYDELEFELEARPGGESPGDLWVECKTSAGEANLAAQALRALERHTGWGLAGRVVIHKHIPVGAGLGGGSSDAAAALLAGVEALAEAGGPVPDDAELVTLARGLGADVAFFLDPFPAIGRGIGELLEPLDLPELSVVLVFFDRMLSTARVYRSFDSMQIAESRSMFEFRAGQAEKRWRQVADVGQMARMLQNDLERASFSLIPSLMTDREILIREGAIGALMSGSGPTLFALCASKDKVEELRGRLTVRGFRAQVATTHDGAAEHGPDEG
jgi:4-diphosphocytidyl-2-C-methyl-D-erythritol kinase